MTFDGHACVTATRGKRNKSAAAGHKFDDKYGESKEWVQALIDLIAGEFILETPWKVERTRWLLTVVIKLYNFFADIFNWALLVFSQTLRYAGLQEREAVKFANERTAAYPQ
jgi:hypothetical protein